MLFVTQSDLGGFLRLGLGLLLGFQPGVSDFSQCQLHGLIELGLGHAEFLELAAHQLQLEGNVDFLTLGGNEGHGALNVEPCQIPIADVASLFDAHLGERGSLGGGGLGGDGVHGQLAVLHVDLQQVGELLNEAVHIPGHHVGGVVEDLLLRGVLRQPGVLHGLPVDGVVVDPNHGGVLGAILPEHLTLEGLIGLGVQGVPHVSRGRGGQVLVGPVKIGLQGPIAQGLNGQLVGTGQGNGGIGGGVHGVSSLGGFRPPRGVGSWSP